MGTQLSYGGSGTAPWEEAADETAVLDAQPASDSPAATDGPPDGGSGEGDSTVDSLITHIIEAIEGQDRRPIPGAPSTYTPANVRPSKYVAGGSSVHSGTSKFVSTPRSGRSSRQSTARGAAAVSAGAALARGDANALRELGLDLAELRTLSPREQQQRILDEILGAPGHPDDEALRRATHATLKAIAADPDIAQDAQIDYLLASYVYEQALVELTSQHANRQLSREAVTKLDNRLKPYIFKKAKHQLSSAGRYLSPALFIEKATSLVATVFRVMRGGRRSGS
ncbi:hypothetical protein JOF29_002812 [Kribbella aluminosa]|uniref:Uncharacterized protein n=1 Tax=Kribbella aluminosa TaxID=416017 RepID=A0ABS4UJL3_9ACTN|nr:hypothetical protein [Kribbella aluminosa]MBP2351729.1 hypothetical protein [Kribbella aluminosa]